MKYKVLLTGRHYVTIDAFFFQLFNEFELLTTSTRVDDLQRHMQLFQPNLLVVCLNGETEEDVQVYKEIRQYIDRYRVSIVVIGEQEDVATFQRTTLNMADLLIRRPVTTSTIKQTILNMMEELELDEKKAEEHAKKKTAAASSAIDDTISEMKKAELERRKRILIVDDEPIMLKMIKEQLKADFDVATAVSGRLALNYLSSKSVDLILLDYEMPEENGADVLKKIKADPEKANTPVVFLTGVTEKTKIQEVLSYKPQGYILKPVSKQKLQEMIDSVLKKSVDEMFAN